MYARMLENYSKLILNLYYYRFKKFWISHYFSIIDCFLLTPLPYCGIISELSQFVLFSTVICNEETLSGGWQLVFSAIDLCCAMLMRLISKTGINN